MQSTGMKGNRREYVSDRDKVVHPMHGAGVIDSIVDERINGKTQAYYVFRMPVNGLVLKIPTANSDAVGLRAVVDPDYADEVIRSLSHLQIDMTTNWNRRYRENLERIKSGNLYEVARVIKCLMLRDASGASPPVSGRCCTAPSRSSFLRSFWQKISRMASLRGGSMHPS